MSQDLNPLIWSISARRVNGEITIGDISVSDLADEFETPVFILDTHRSHLSQLNLRAGFNSPALDFNTALMVN